MASAKAEARKSSSPGKKDLLEGQWKTKQEAWSTSVVATKPLCVGPKVYNPFPVHKNPAITVCRSQGGIWLTEGGCGLKCHLNP